MISMSCPWYDWTPRRPTSCHSMRGIGAGVANHKVLPGLGGMKNDAIMENTKISDIVQ